MKIQALLLLSLLLPWMPVHGDIREPFQRPAAFEPDITFWKRIYTEVDTDAGLLHDRQHLGVVYEVVRFPPDASRRERSRLVDERRRTIREQLLALAQNPESDTAAAHRLRSLWGEKGSVAQWRAAADRIRFQLGQADRFRAGLERSGRWDADFRQTMRENGVPEGMAALPHVESSFTPHARSRVGAAGMWQFTRGAAERFMQVDHAVDERLDPWRAAEAAAQLLRYNREVTGSWALALTAYNHGAAGVRRAVEITGTDDIVEIAREYEGRRFGFASRNFYPAFLAALDIHAEPDRYFPDVTLDGAASNSRVRMPDYMDARTVADALNVAPEALRRRNPALLDPIWNHRKYIPRGYELRLPPSVSLDEASRRLASVPNDRRYVRQAPDRYHVLRRGETLSHVGSRYGVSVRELVRINNLRSAHRVRAGQRLTLPGGEQGTVIAEAVPEDGLYEVRPGDNLSLIAERFSTTTRRLVQLNELRNGDRIYPGQSLRVVARRRGEESGEASSDVEAASRPAEEEVAVAEGAEEGTSARSVPEEQPELAADPSDYAVSPDGRITLQWSETLGHHAEWLDVRTQRLRDLNGLRFGESVAAGRRLTLDFSEVEPSDYEARRLDYHEGIQRRFFSRFRIAGSRDYTVQAGDSLWRIARRHGDLPEWLIQQYNPDRDLDSLRPGNELRLPVLEERP